MDILVVDDSSLFRLAITDLVKEIPGVSRVKTAANGKMAMDILESNKVDITILDVEMPVMDGIDVLRQIKEKEINTKALMFSNLTEKGAEKTIEALNLGAIDFVAKVAQGDGSGMEAIKDTLIPKIKGLLTLSGANVGPRTNPTNTDNNQVSAPPQPVRKKTLKANPHLYDVPRILCIGSSTGGPEALGEVFRSLTGPFNFPIVLAQHMPKFFTKKLADHLNSVSSVTVKEAEAGEVLKNNVCYIAPGDFHMTVEKKGTDLVVGINQGEKVCFVRPSVDVLFWSVQKLALPHVSAIIMTGMGSDGKEGCESLAKDGYPIVIQDEESCVVWGMPGAVADSGVQSLEENLQGISNYINRLK
jgi:two-component system chemotaxis response regulator CheB